MKLGSKTFLYSVIISLIVGIVIFSYMVFLMPSMYMDYKGKQNLESARSAMKHFKKHESLKNFKTGDANTLGVIIPGNGYTIRVTGSSFNGSIEAVSPASKEIIDQFRSLDMSSKSSKKEAFKNLKPALKAFAEENSAEMNSSFKINLKGDSSLSQFKVKDKKFHYYSGGVLISEFSVESRYSGTSYTYFVGFAKHGDDMLILSSTTMTPSASEILPVLYGSAPMLVLLMIILAFGVSAIYSRKIVSPIKKLSMDAERRMSSSSIKLEPLEAVGNDEISDLTAALNLLYEKQAQAVQNLEEENKRKEVYMRATSHQLKTPIAASMLLVDGMIGKVGKFGDRDLYLPEVKAQLREMMSIIDETSKFLLDSRGELSIIPQKDEIDELINKAEVLLKKDKNNVLVRQYLITLYLKKGGDKNILKAQKISEENLQDREITGFGKWSTTGLYYYQIGQKEKAQVYFNKIKQKYKDKPAVYDLIEIATMEIDIHGKSKNFQELLNQALENEKKMKEIKEISDKQMKKIVVVKDFFQSEENKREFKIVDELVYGFDLTLNFSKINEILENYSEDSSEEKTEVIKKAIDYYLRNIANNEKMTEDSIKYNIILENMYLKIMRMVASFDEKESEEFLNKLEKSKLYEVMRKLEE